MKEGYDKATAALFCLFQINTLISRIWTIKEKAATSGKVVGSKNFYNVQCRLKIVEV